MHAWRTENVLFWPFSPFFFFAYEEAILNRKAILLSCVGFIMFCLWIVYTADVASTRRSSDGAFGRRALSLSFFWWANGTNWPIGRRPSSPICLPAQLRQALLVCSTRPSRYACNVVKELVFWLIHQSHAGPIAFYQIASATCTCGRQSG